MGKKNLNMLKYNLNYLVNYYFEEKLFLFRREPGPSPGRGLVIPIASLLSWETHITLTRNSHKCLSQQVYDCASSEFIVRRTLQWISIHPIHGGVNTLLNDSACYRNRAKFRKCGPFCFDFVL